MKFRLRAIGNAFDIQATDRFGFHLYGFGGMTKKQAKRALHYYKHHYKGTCKDWLPF